MYYRLSFLMLLSVESFAMDDASESGAGSLDERASVVATTPQGPKKRSRREVDSPTPPVALAALDDKDETDDEVTELLGPPPILRTSWSAKDQANAFKSDINDLMETICPGASALLSLSPPISTSPEGCAFFLKPGTFAGFEGLLEVLDAAPFKGRIEELQCKFLERQALVTHHEGAAMQGPPAQ